MNILFIGLLFLLIASPPPPKKETLLKKNVSVSKLKKDAQNVNYPNHKLEFKDLESPTKDFNESPIVIYLDNHPQSEQFKDDVFLRNRVFLNQRKKYKERIMGSFYISFI
jgi:hypothetical protein